MANPTTTQRRTSVAEAVSMPVPPHLDSLSREQADLVRRVFLRFERKNSKQPATRMDAGFNQQLAEYARELQIADPEYRVPATAIPWWHSCNFLSRVGATTFRSNEQMTLEDCPCGSVRRLPQFDGDFPSYWDNKNSRRKMS